ncbi:hypothetical protein V7024_16745 [Bacillus sp. JJ864]|uniref:hypothetical protein n=1 Tax=Bacillus sp. JJ864 TaxID=3122975 RepID=UPI002FFDE636
MIAIWEGDYMVIEDDEDVIQRSTINISKLSTEKDPKDPAPSKMKLYDLYDRALISIKAANEYVLYRQVYLNHYGKDAKDRPAKYKYGKIRERR